MAARTHRPQLTDAAKPATFEVEAYNERGEMVPTSIAGEHPLTLYLDKKELVTLMTLGHAPEALAIGYLRNQRLVGSLEDIVAVQVDWETESCAIATRKGVKDLKRLVRGGASDEAIRDEIAALWQRREDRYSEIRTAETARLRKIEMSYIGG